MSKQRDRDKSEAITTLLDQYKLAPGDTVYTNLIHRSKSGMYRVIDCYIIRDNVPLRISWSVADATGHGYDKRHEGIKAHGCGMDMGFQVVYNLSRALFHGKNAEGQYVSTFGCIGEGCPSNDHNNGERDHTIDGLTRVAHTCKKGRRSSDIACSPEACVETVMHVHSDGGYALLHRWL